VLPAITLATCTVGSDPKVHACTPGSDPKVHAWVQTLAPGSG